MQHDVGLQAGDTRELLAALGARWLLVLSNVGGQVEPKVILHVERASAMMTTEWFILFMRLHVPLELVPLVKHL